MIRDFNIQAEVTRTISVSGTDIEVEEFDPVERTFTAQLQVPTVPTPGLDGVRRTRPHILRWRKPPFGPEPDLLGPGARVVLSGVIEGRPYENRAYEFNEDPRVVRLGSQDIGYEAAMLETDGLYGVEGVISDGTDDHTVFVAFSPDGAQYHTDTGTYQNWIGYASVADRDLFRQNRRLVVGGRRFMLTGAFVDYTTLRTQFTAVLSNAF